MPVYICFRGDADNVALELEDSFAVKDARGRTWICFQSDRPFNDPGELKESEIYRQANAMQQALDRGGFRTEGTEVAQVECDAVEELAQMLGAPEVEGG